MVKFLITGPPGCGKTTFCERIIERLKDRMRIGGFVSGEIREGGFRAGFRVRDISSGDVGVLAHVDRRVGPRLGRYGVNLDDLNSVGVGAIRNALRDCDLVVVDEIGPMELFSKEFVEAVGDVFASDRHVVATIHYRSKDRLVKDLGLEDVPVLVLDEGNRERLLDGVLEKIV